MNGLASIITALGSLAIALTGLFTILKTFREVRKVHTIVNQQRTDMTAYQLKLTQSLRAHGIEIPVDDSVAPPP